MYKKTTVFFLCVYFFSIPLSKSFVDYSVLLALPFYVIHRFRNLQNGFFKDKIFIFLLLFAASCFVSVFFAGAYFEKALKAFFLKWCQNFVLFIMVADILREPRYFDRALKCFLAGLLVVLVDAWIQKISGQELLLSRSMTPVKLFFGPGLEKIYYAITGTFNHANGLAAYLVFCILWLIAVLDRKSVFFLGYLALISLAGAALLYTYTRGAWFALSAGLLLLLFCQKHGRFWLGTLFLSFVAFLFLSPGLREKIIYSFTTLGDSERFELWSVATALIRRSPLFGNGLGTFMDYTAAASSGRVIKYAHNCYLQVWAESGLLALLSFLGFIYLIFKRVWQFFLRTKDHTILGIGAGVFALLLHSAFDVHFYSLQLSALIWGALGLLMARSWEKNTIL